MLGLTILFFKFRSNRSIGREISTFRRKFATLLTIGAGSACIGAIISNYIIQPLLEYGISGISGLLILAIILIGLGTYLARAL